MPDRIKNAIVDLAAQIGWIEENDYHKFPGWQNVTDAMREAVALLKEQKDVVRCKDCTHTDHCEIYAGWDGKHPDWFCADGERRQA